MDPHTALQHARHLGGWVLIVALLSSCTPKTNDSTAAGTGDDRSEKGLQRGAE